MMTCHYCVSGMVYKLTLAVRDVKRQFGMLFAYHLSCELTTLIVILCRSADLRCVVLVNEQLSTSRDLL